MQRKEGEVFLKDYYDPVICGNIICKIRREKKGTCTKKGREGKGRREEKRHTHERAMKA